MKSAKALGFIKGDVVQTEKGQGFPAILIGDAHMTTPLCEVWGFEREMGSVYSEDLVKISDEKFLELIAHYGHSKPASSVSKAAQEVINRLQRRVGC